MNPTNQHDETSTAELQDRLMDRALAEVVGGENPPDLAQRILAADPKRQLAKSPDQRVGVRQVALVTVAASLAIATGLVLMQQGAFKGAAYESSSRATAKMGRALTRAPDAENSIGRGGEISNLRGTEKSKGTALLKEISQKESASVPAFAAEEAKEVKFETVMSSVQEVPLARLSDARPLSALDALHAGQTNSDQSKTSFGYQWNASDDVAVHDQPLRRSLHFYSSSDWGFPYDSRRAKFGRGELGTGPGESGDQYTRIHENPFIKAVGGDAVSTFSIDVDTASYANVRQILMDLRRLPPPDAVRIEELVNYFDYDYAGPTADNEAPFAAHIEVAGCPWTPEHRLVRIGVKGREIANDKRPPSNLVFLVDVSGSMDEPNKLPLVVDGLRQLTRELGENDRVAIVVYASSEGLALPSTRGDQQQAILEALGRLQAGGSTAGGAGIQLAYQVAQDHFIPGGTNRVVLCTDGDFNVGVTSTAELERLVAQKAKDTKVFLSVLGFGRGNLNDAMMQTIADRGNGNHHYVDNLREARKVLVEEMTGTLITIAKDVKLQVEFNPAQVSDYRLLGYENRLLRTEDFNDDTKDAGEIGAGHTVTALYEVVPAGKHVNVPAADELKYQANNIPKEDAPIVAASNELLTLKMRYKQPEGDTSRKLEWSTTDAQGAFQDATDDFRFAAAVAEYGLLLRGSEFKGAANFEAVAEIASGSLGADPRGYRTEFVELVRRAAELASGR